MTATFEGFTIKVTKSGESAPAYLLTLDGSNGTKGPDTATGGVYTWTLNDVPSAPIASQKRTTR